MLRPSNGIESVRTPASTKNPTTPTAAKRTACRAITGPPATVMRSASRGELGRAATDIVESERHGEIVQTLQLDTAACNGLEHQPANETQEREQHHAGTEDGGREPRHEPGLQVGCQDGYFYHHGCQRQQGEDAAKELQRLLQ